MDHAHQPDQLTFKAILPEDIEWNSLATFPPGARLAVVVDHPSEQRPYAIRVNVPLGSMALRAA